MMKDVNITDMKKMTGKLLLGGNALTIVIGVMFLGLLSSCSDYIDPAAANSLSAIIAVIGEYVYAIIALVLVAILWIFRPAGVALAVLGVLGLCDFVELSINATYLICIGVLMFFASFAPIKPYKPLVVISKHFKMPKEEKGKEKLNSYQDFFVQLLVGVIILVIEYSIFAR